MRDLTKSSCAERLEQLTTRCITTIHAYSEHEGDRPLPELIECLGVVQHVVERHGGMGRAYRRDAVVQHLLASLMGYTNKFEPRFPWKVVGSQPEDGYIHWRHPDPAVPDVIDVISVRGPFSKQQIIADSDCVIRLCDILNPDLSQLSFPGDPTVYRWCVADDPIFSREMAVLA